MLASVSRENISFCIFYYVAELSIKEKNIATMIECPLIDMRWEARSKAIIFKMQIPTMKHS